MLRRHFLSILLTALPGLSLAGTEPELPEDDVQVVYENEMYVGRFSFVVAVPPTVAWEVLTDFDHMADFVPNLEASRVIAREAGVVHIAQRGKMDFGPFTFRFESERRVEARQREGLLIARAVSGSAKHMQSEMRLTPEAGGTRLDYRVEMVPERWIPSSLGVGFMRHELAEQFTAIAREMVRRQRGRRTS
jgi:carbon monoxide dehydrogenase subunit G